MQYNYPDEILERKKKELLDKVNGLNDEFNELLPSLDNTNASGFKFMIKDPTSDKTLKNKAEEQANSEYEQKKTKAEEDTNKKATSLEQSIKELLESAESKKQDTAVSYDRSKKSVEEDASKRGISRSSIANGSIADIENRKLDALGKIDEDTAIKSNNIQFQIEELQNKLNELISTFEEQRLASAEELFEKAKEARDKNNAEVDKYNNSLRQFEMQHGIKKSTTEAEEVELEYAKKKIAAVVNFYNSFADRSKALEDFMSNDELHKALGSSYDECLRLIYGV